MVPEGRMLRPGGLCPAQPSRSCSTNKELSPPRARGTGSRSGSATRPHRPHPATLPKFRAPAVYSARPRHPKPEPAWRRHDPENLSKP